MSNNELVNWLESFWKVLVSPSSKTFIREAGKGNGKFGSSVAWLAFLAVYVFLSAVLLADASAYSLAVPIILIIVLPGSVVILTSAMHFVYQRFFHRKSYIYDALLYITTAILVPFEMIAIPLSLALPVEIGNPVFDIFLLYQLALMIWAFAAISKLKIWQAVVTVLIGVIAGAFAFVCILPLVAGLMGGVSGVMR